jgi:hypothetical protein
MIEGQGFDALAPCLRPDFNILSECVSVVFEQW